MVSITIKGNFPKLISNIRKLEKQLTMLNIPLKELEDSLGEVYAQKFRSFEKHRDRLSPSYRKWKDERGLPVGVKTGKTRRALVEGAEGKVEGINPFGNQGFTYTYGIHEGSFQDRRGYPRKFDEWLEQWGDDLIGLSDVEAEALLDELAIYVKQFIDSY